VQICLLFFNSPPYPELVLVKSILDKNKIIQKIIGIHILRENLGRRRGRSGEYLLLSLISRISIDCKWLVDHPINVWVSRLKLQVHQIFLLQKLWNCQKIKDSMSHYFFLIRSRKKFDPKHKVENMKEREKLLQRFITGA